jgi:hypothetical protein
MRRVLVVAFATLFLLAGAGVARADHTHVLILPNGKCAPSSPPRGTRSI